MRREIYESWRRSKKWKVNPNLTVAPIILEDQKLSRRMKKYGNLLSISRPIMEDIYSLVIGGGFIVSLSDPEGILLEIVGDKVAQEKAQVVNFVPGASWAESMVGTNGMGTPLYLDKPTQVSRAEHYCLYFQKWAGSGAPIHDPSGKISGVLGICGPFENVHSHTLGIVVTAVNAIESQLKVENTMSSLSLADHYKNTIIESISEGLIALDSEGIITHINEVIASLFDIRKEELLNRNLLSIISKKNSAFHNIINKKEIVTDLEMNIVTDHGKIAGLITTRPIIIRGATMGTLLLFKDIARARRLVQHLAGKETKFNFSDLIGKDHKFLETVELARTASGSNSNVLLLGESGSGKDIFAQSIHNASSRKNGPFVALNCAAMPRELIASELFGYVEGAYTGARRGGKPGKFELASGGTIFLDEIGEMPLELQTTLLRVLESRTITRVGGSEVIPVDVRIIAATNRDLSSAVLMGHFRQDLFYRLNVFSIHMVPLRDRKNDLNLLVDHFLKTISAKLNKSTIKNVSPEVMALFTRYNWPGNIRELQNIMERAINICSGEVLLPEYLSRELSGFEEPEVLKAKDHYERDLICSFLSQYHNNISRVAKSMGIARTTLYRKLRKYKLSIPSQ
ncbi:MAG: sigma-54-dependent Fis family transcriptional regulator [Syntrophales bacterium]